MNATIKQNVTMSANKDIVFFIHKLLRLLFICSNNIAAASRTSTAYSTLSKQLEQSYGYKMCTTPYIAV